MNQKRRTTEMRTQWRVAGFVAGVTAAIAASQSAAADPLSPVPTMGTATGIYRTGLAKAGLVSVESLDSAHVWVARTSLDGEDAGKRFDVRVELLDNGAVVASGVQRCVGPLDLTPTEVTVPWSSFTPPAVSNGDVLALRVSTRIGTNANDSACKFKGQASGVRLFCNSATSASRFGAQITPSPTVELYLRSGASLHEDAPNAGPASTADSGAVAFKGGNVWKTIGTWSLAEQADCGDAYIQEVETNPPAPEPEPVTVTHLPLPPTAPSTTAGSCSAAVNPNGTGCINVSDSGIAEGPAYMWDGHHVLLPISFVGAPAAPDPASIYSGNQVIAIKTDGTTFSNGDPWKCITCGVPAANKPGISSSVDHPQAFHGGSRALVGTNVLDCSPHRITDDACTPAPTHIYPIRWDRGGTGSGGSMRELRLHPDDVHLGWNNLVFSATAIEEFAYLGRFVFNSAPTVGTPLVPRYEFSGRADPAWSPDGTDVVYWQALATSPACGPANPSVPTCPISTEPGGRRTRLMIARLTSRAPLSIAQPAPIADEIPWGIEFHPGDPNPVRPHLPPGTYTLEGKVHGSAAVVITENATLTNVGSIDVTYTGYSDDGVNVLNSTESAAASPGTWHESLALTGCHTGSKVTTEPGGFTSSGTTRTGTLTTTVDGAVYTSPPSGT